MRYAEPPGIRVAGYMWHTYLIIIQCTTTHVNAVITIITIIAHEIDIQKATRKQRTLNGSSDRKITMLFALKFARFFWMSHTF